MKIKAIFLDRDGVINKFPGYRKYVTTWKTFCFLPRSKEAITALAKAKFKIFVISNQAGVGKGILSKSKLDLITKNMLTAIKKTGGKIDKVYYCIHRPEENCVCRKPKAGTVRSIMGEYSLDIKKTFFIGDTVRDVKTAHAAGCKSIMVLSGREKISNRRNWQVQPDFVFKDLWEAANFILSFHK